MDDFLAQALIGVMHARRPAPVRSLVTCFSFAYNIKAEPTLGLAPHWTAGTEGGTFSQPSTA